MKISDIVSCSSRGYFIFALLFNTLLLVPSRADYVKADSQSFILYCLTYPPEGTYTFGDSNNFSIEVLNLHRGWCDSADFWICLKYGDFDVDCCVNLADLDIFVGHWLDMGCSEPNWCSWADFEKSGSVDFVDFSLLAENWLCGCEN